MLDRYGTGTVRIWGHDVYPEDALASVRAALIRAGVVPKEGKGEAWLRDGPSGRG